MRTDIKITDIQCSCCPRTVGQDIGIIPGVYGVTVDYANKTISVEHTEEVDRQQIEKRLEVIGYTPTEK